MHSNDLVLLDKIIENDLKNNIDSLTIGEHFETFAIQQILKNYDLSIEDIENGIVDGENDGGIDSIYLFVNSINVASIDAIPEIKSDIVLDLFIITAKHDDTFKQAPLSSVFSTISEFFDLSKNESNFQCCYNKEILKKRKLFVQFYTNNISIIRDFRIHYYYVSRGDSTIVSKNVFAKRKQIVEATKNYLTSCIVDFSFTGASELLTLYRKKLSTSGILPCVEVLSSDDRKFIVLCKLSDFFSFITDEQKELKRYLFDSNVRDFNGFNTVNESILSTLNTNDEVDFWWLNNGITILSSDANNIGNSLKIENIQIVNGLQTSFAIFEYFKSKSLIDDNRKIMVKVITETDNEVRDRIIRATNSQTSIEQQALHATDKIQRDIEEILKPCGLFYERRTNFYKNQGKDYFDIVTPLYAASCYYALIDKNIEKAINVRQRFMNNEDMYKHVFETININCWPIIIKISKLSEYFLLKEKIVDEMNSNKKIRILRCLLMFLATADYFKKLNFCQKDLLSLSIDELSKFRFKTIFNLIVSYKIPFEKNKWKKSSFLYSLIGRISKDLEISGMIVFLKTKITNCENVSDYKDTYELIKQHIPDQPWPVKLHKSLSKDLGLSETDISCALSYSIKIGKYHFQYKQIMYDNDGCPLNYDFQKLMPLKPSE